jgi:serine/threonine-protein kinase
MLAGRYRALSLLRADRACAHLAALHTSTSTRVEVQVLLAMDDAIEGVHLQLLADARKAAAVQSRHADRVLHVGITDDGHPFVVREPSSGKTLAELLHQVGSLPTEQAVDVAVAVCEALESAHALGLVHGELDPTMVRLDWGLEGPTNVKVAGLGTSRALGLLSLENRSFAQVALRAPELLVAGREIDARADVWGVGVLLYTMLAGATPFGAESPSKMDVTAAGDEPALLAGVPDGLAELVDACLAKDPAQRPATAASVAATLGVFGSRPVFDKRPSLLVVDTGPYDALVLEQLVKEAAPSTPQVAPQANASPVPAPDKTPVPVVVTRSLLPPAVAVTIAPNATSSRTAPPSRSWRSTALVAAACIALGVVAGAFAMRRASAIAPVAPVAAAQAPAPVAAEPLPAPEVKVATSASVAQPAPSPSMPTLSVSDLPATHVAPPSRRPRGSKVAQGATPEAPAPPADPIVQSASAPMQPQPKASDDDLRRFLDDRR